MAKTKGRNAKDSAGPVLVADDPTPEPEPQILDPDEPDEPEAAPEAAKEREPAAPGRDPRTVPRIHGELPANELLSFVAQHPNPQDLDGYVYRLKPKIRRIRPAEWPSGKKFPSYVEKLKGLITERTQRVFDLDWLRAVRGSGKYLVQINDRSVTRTRNVQLCHGYIEINEYDNYPPVFDDWAELVPCDENKWFIEQMLRDKVIRRTAEGNFVAYEVEPAKPQQQQMNTMSDPAVLLDKTLNAAERMAKLMTPPPQPAVAKEESPFEKIDIVGLIDKTHAANDPIKMLDGFKQLAGILKPDAPAADPLAIALRIAEALKPPPPAAPVDPLLQMKTQLEMIKTIKETFGDSEKEAAETRSRMNGWQEFFKEPLTELLSGLKPLFKVGADLIYMKNAHPPAANAAQTRPTANAPQPAIQPQSQGAPGQPPPPNPPATAAQAGEPEEQPPQMNRQQAEAHMIMTGLASVAPTLIKYFEDEELTGEHFASWFCDASLPTGLPNMPMVPELVDGIDALPMLKTYGAENIRNLIRQNAGLLYTRIAPTEGKEAAFLKFLEEFLKYDPEAEPEAK